MRRGIVLLVVAVAGVACNSLHPVSVADFQMTPGLASTYLRYRVASPRGTWTRQFVVGRRDFAELREVGGRSYALGIEGALAWLRVGARPPVEIDGELAFDERTQAAWIGVRFGAPAPGEHLELESCTGAVCTLVYTPRDGHALWVDVDRKTHRPVAFAWIARDHAVESCEDVTWSDEGGAPVIASATCSAIVDEVGRVTTTWSLEEREGDAETPAWARVSPQEVVPLRAPREVSSFAIADPSQRVYVPVEAGGSQPLQLVLDTGSPITVLTRRVVDELGVVPSPDPPHHVKPPWLPEDTYDQEIVDRLVFGGVELHGVPVLVARNDPFGGAEAGLLGMDVLSRYVVDVDGPDATLRIWPRGVFARSTSNAAFTDVQYFGASHGAVVVGGAVDELGAMPVIVDTGAPLNVVVGGPAMRVRHPHTRRNEVHLSETDDYDYETEIDGFRLGPFHLPRMPAVGHDRRPDLPFLDGGGALVGLGVLRHFRMAIDPSRGIVHFAPGASYVVLDRLGVELDERGGRPVISRTTEDEGSWNKPLRVGDIVHSVGGHRVRSRDEALRSIASAGDTIRLVLERRGNLVARTVRTR
ncbi:MAG TPA: aspartyl protease family protein [Polyangiaceae bacterium]